MHLYLGKGIGVFITSIGGYYAFSYLVPSFPIWLSQLLFLFLPSLVYLKKEGHLKSLITFKKITWGKTFRVLVTMLGTSVTIILIASIFNYFFPIPENYLNMLNSMATIHTPLEGLKIILTLGVIPAISEEFIFRGVLFTSLTYKLSLHTSWIIVTIIFAALHLNPWLFIFYLILGAYISYLRWQHHTLIYSILAHALNNLMAITILNLS